MSPNHQAKARGAFFSTNKYIACVWVGKIALCCLRSKGLITTLIIQLVRVTIKSYALL